MSTYAYDQLVRAFKQARREVRAGERVHRDPGRTAQQGAGIELVAEALVDILADDDPKFDAEAFRRAVGA